MNLIHGSSVWVQSVSQTLTEIPGVELTLLLRTHEQRDVLTAPLHANPRIELVDPEHFGSAKPLDSESAVHVLESLDAERSFDVVLLRGAAICAEAARRHTFQGRLWCYYLTPHEFRPGQEVDQLRLIAPACERVLCQTEAIRELVAAAIPDQVDKLALLPPMIPPVSKSAEEREGTGGLKLVCAGKSPPILLPGDHRHLPAAGRDLPDAEFHLIGDKIHNPPDDPGFKPAVDAALAETEKLFGMVASRVTRWMTCSGRPTSRSPSVIR